jgi:hypothetical protein
MTNKTGTRVVRLPVRANSWTELSSLSSRVHLGLAIGAGENCNPVSSSGSLPRDPCRPLVHAQSELVVGWLFSVVEHGFEQVGSLVLTNPREPVRRIRSFSMDPDVIQALPLGALMKAHKMLTCAWNDVDMSLCPDCGRMCDGVRSMQRLREVG